MKKALLVIGLCISGAAFGQNQPDSIHIVLHENQNGSIRVLDTIVPLSQQQQLFTWMEQNGWDAPPPPPPPGTEPFPMEHIIIIEGDSGLPMKQGERHVMIMHGSCDSIPAVPPGAKVHMRQENGDMTYMRIPAHPDAPGSDVRVNVVEKDTIIDGKPHKMIIRTERIILPEGVDASPMPPHPPVPPQAPKAPNPPHGEKHGTVAKQDLLVYPNPANSIISVEFDLVAKEKTTLRVIDMNGIIVYNEEITDDSSKHVYREINLSGKGKGTYTVEVVSPKKKIAEKVILQ